MNQQAFLAALRGALGSMPEQDKAKILRDYEGQFRAGLAAGKGEEELASALGDPLLLGRSHRIDALLQEPEEGGGAKAKAVAGAVLLSLSVSLFNGIFVLGPFAAFLGALAGLWAAALSVAAAGLACILSPAAWAIAPALRPYLPLRELNVAFVLLCGVALAALGLLAFIGMAQLSRLALRAVAAYVKFSLRLVRRRR